MGADAGFYAYAQPSTDPSKVKDNNRYVEHEIFVDPVVRDRTNNRIYALEHNFQFLGNTRRNVSGSSVRFPVRLSSMGGMTVFFTDELGMAASFPEHERLLYNPTPRPNKDARELVNHGWPLDPPRLTAESDNCDGSRDRATRPAIDEHHGGKS